ncbi:MAG: hypothetical protein CFE43_02035 [Burkholderiales bacterium PBB3]|nr:MAG: hypothetical protein CFE43_02035 [Burkholderiales bacterium PBB3]
MGNLDSLAERALNAMSTDTTNAASWLVDKRRMLDGKDRLWVLAWIVFDLDHKNMTTVSRALELTIDDLTAVKRVLQKI